MIYKYKTPARIIYTHGGNDYRSFWNAVHNPIVFVAQRKDFIVSSVQLNNTIHPGKTNVIPTTGVGSDIWMCLAQGDKVYVESGSYVGAFTVLDVSNHPPFIVLDYDYAGPAAGGYVNAITTAENYHIKTDVCRWTNYTEEYIGSLRNSPDAKGFATIDPSQLLRSVVGYVNDYNYSSINVRDLNLGDGYRMESRFVYINRCTKAVVEGAAMNWGVFFFVNAAKQLREKYGQSMGEQVMTDANVAQDKKGKFLTAFKRPRYFKGYPYDLSFIYSDHLAGYVVKREVTTYDANGNTLTNNQATLNDHRYGVNRMLHGIGGSPAMAEVWLIIDGVYTDCYVDDDYVDDMYTMCTNVIQPGAGDIPDASL